VVKVHIVSSPGHQHAPFLQARHPSHYFPDRAIHAITYVVAQEDCKVEVPQVYHVARQHAQLVAAVIKEAQNAENKRMKR
jgi:hypothetical protein